MGAIYLVRHGQASFGAADYDALSPVGVEQAAVLGAALLQRALPVDRVECGPMRRHRQTAENCLQAMNLPARWDEAAGWQEYDHDEVIARFDARYADPVTRHEFFADAPDPRRAFHAMFEHALARWVGGEHDADYRESWAAFNTRVLQAMHALVESLGPSKTALVFTSGGPVTAITADLLHVPLHEAWRINRIIANASVTKLVYSDRGVYLASFNEHAHFENGGSRKLITYR